MASCIHVRHSSALLLRFLQLNPSSQEESHKLHAITICQKCDAQTAMEATATTPPQPIHW